MYEKKKRKKIFYTINRTENLKISLIFRRQTFGLVNLQMVTGTPRKSLLDDKTPSFTDQFLQEIGCEAVLHLHSTVTVSPFPLKKLVIAVLTPKCHWVLYNPTCFRYNVTIKSKLQSNRKYWENSSSDWMMEWEMHFIFTMRKEIEGYQVL